MNFKGSFRKAALCLLAFVALGISPTLLSAQTMPVLGGTLSWTTTSGYEPCGDGEFQIMQYTSFTWQHGSTAYPVSGSTAYIYDSPGLQCPQDGPQGGVGYNIPSGLDVPNSAFVFIPTGPGGNGGGGGTIIIQYPSLQLQDSAAGAQWQRGTNTGSDCLQQPQQTQGSGGPIPGQSSPLAPGAPSGDQSLLVTDLIGSCALNSNGTLPGEWNVLGFKNLCGGAGGGLPDCPAVSNFSYDVWFYLPSGTTYEALEFDPDITVLDSTKFSLSHAAVSNPQLLDCAALFGFL